MMKRVWRSAVACLLVAAGWVSAVEWKNTLKPKGEAASPLTLVKDGKAVYSIVVPAGASSVEKNAAAELQRWVREMSGAELSIVEKGEGEVIRITTDPKLEAEGYRVGVDGKELVLSGAKGRGVMDAVFALLEEDMGCRWYTKGDTRLPRGKTVVVAPVPRTYVPKLKMRDPFYFASFDPEWSLRNRTNAPDAQVAEEKGGHIDYGGLFVHTQHSLVPPDRYFKEHPEYYQQNPDGKRVPVQLCTTNAEVRKIATQSVLETLKKHPETEVVSVSRLDVTQVCHCAECEKVRASEGSEMANQLLLVNEVAEAVEREFPGVMVDTLAYLETLPVPKTVRPRKNVIIRFCNDVPGAWAHSFTPAERCDIAKIAEAWAAAHDKLSVWDYNVNFSHYLAPMPNVDVIASNIRFWAKHHAWGVMTQGGYQGAAERDELKSWVIAKLMWDQSLDEKALTEEFYAGHYGPAADAMLEYDALLGKAGKDHEKELATPPGGIRYPMDVPFLSKEFLDQATAIFAKAKEAAGKDEEIVRRVERAELPILYVKLMQGPTGKDLAEFDRVAHREGATHIAEVWPANTEATIASWRAQVVKGATSRPTTAEAKAAPVVISKGMFALAYQAFPDVCRLKSGDLLAVFYAGYGHGSLPSEDYPKGGRICMVRSMDDGRTWSSPEVLFDDADDNRDPHVAQLDDGTVVCSFFSHGLRAGKEPLKSSAAFNWKEWAERGEGRGTQVVFSHDEGHTWDKTATSVSKEWYASAPVRQMPDGTCVLGVYQEGTEKKGDFTVAWGGVTRSKDRGKTWETPVAIGKEAGLPLDAETDVIRLKDGSLFAALRSSKVNMHYATSSDGGATWSAVKDIGFKGHSPHLYRLSTGEIVMAHRLPQTALHVSRDEGKTWQGPVLVDDVIGAYPSCVELNDHSVLIVYYSEGGGSEIRAKRFRVTKDGVEFLPVN